MIGGSASTIAPMSRETKFGYGFLLAGVGLPYVIDKFLGPTAAGTVLILCLIVGVALLVAGHKHKDDPATEVQSLFRGAIPSPYQGASPTVDAPQRKKTKNVNWEWQHQIPQVTQHTNSRP